LPTSTNARSPPKTLIEFIAEKLSVEVRGAIADSEMVEART
jgi:hypothetical protein